MIKCKRIPEGNQGCGPVTWAGEECSREALDQQVQILQLVWGEGESKVLGERKSHLANAAREKEQGRENQKGPGVTGSWSYSF